MKPRFSSHLDQTAKDSACCAPAVPFHWVLTGMVSHRPASKRPLSSVKAARNHDGMPAHNPILTEPKFEEPVGAGPTFARYPGVRPEFPVRSSRALALGARGPECMIITLTRARLFVGLMYFRPQTRHCADDKATHCNIC